MRRGGRRCRRLLNALGRAAAPPSLGCGSATRRASGSEVRCPMGFGRSSRLVRSPRCSRPRSWLTWSELAWSRSTTRWRRTCPWPAGTVAADHVGLGWLILSGDKALSRARFAHDVLIHDGGTGGYRSFVGLAPETGTAVVVLSARARSVSSLGVRLLRITSRPSTGAGRPQRRSSTHSAIHSGRRQPVLRMVADPDGSSGPHRWVGTEAAGWALIVGSVGDCISAMATVLFPGADALTTALTIPATSAESG